MNSKLTFLLYATVGISVFFGSVLVLNRVYNGEWSLGTHRVEVAVEEAQEETANEELGSPATTLEDAGAFPDSAREAIEAMTLGRPGADPYIVEEALSLLPPDAALLPAGSNIEADEATWNQNGVTGSVLATVSMSDSSTDEFLVVFALQGGVWKVSSAASTSPPPPPSIPKTIPDFPESARQAIEAMILSQSEAEPFVSSKTLAEGSPPRNYLVSGGRNIEILEDTWKPNSAMLGSVIVGSVFVSVTMADSSVETHFVMLHLENDVWKIASTFKWN